MEEALIDERFKPYILKRYKYWTLLLNIKQRYLGRAVIWFMHPGEMQRYSKLGDDETLELKGVCADYESVLDRVGWKPDHINYAMLGNFFHEHGGHGHMHLIPRYDPKGNTPHFRGIAFKDDRWGQNYAPETPLDIHDRIVRSIAAFLREELAKNS